MVKNYIKIAIRSMMKDKFYAFINVVGLTIGITGSIFVVLYVQNELSYDKFHHESENVYHVALTGRLSGQEVNTSTTSPPLGQSMLDNIPGIEEAVRVRGAGRPVFKYEDKAFAEEKIYSVDSNFFSFFDFELALGDKNQVLMEPNSIVLTEDLAKKYFGDSDPIGNIIQVGNDGKAYEVTGVAKPAPGNSHIKFNALTSMSSLYSDIGPQYWESWLSNSLQTYVRKNPETSVQLVDEKLDELVLENALPILAQFMGTEIEEFQKSGDEYGYWIYPMHDIRLNSKLDHYYEPVGSMTYVYIFSVVGIFIIVIACINFMNLSTAKSSGRSKEVGLRKTMGSFRSQMIGQFLIESILYTLIAAVVGFGLVYLLLPQFNQLAGVNLELTMLFTGKFLLIVTFGILLIGILAGSYPAFYLTSFKIVDVLKGSGISSMKSGGIRSGLVVFQFIISIGLIICTGVVFQQLQYTQNKNLGFDKNNIVVVNHTNRLQTNRIAFKNSLGEQPEIINTSYSNNMFPGVNNTTVFKAVGNEQDYIMGQYFADWDHMEAMGFELIEGRYLSRDFPSDSLNIVVNQATVDHVGWENAIGSELMNYNGEVPVKLTVVGVVKDFNFESLKDVVRPMVIMLTEEANVLYVRYSSSPQEIIATLESQWRELAPNEPFEYSFLDQEFDALFRAEQRLGNLFTVLSGLAIFVSCMGLFGLAAFMAEQRVKEIGIRKALGASRANLMRLLSVEFMKLLAIAFVIAVGPSWYFMKGWLEGFAYRIDLGWFIFVFAGLLSFLVAWLTVSYQAFRAASANPVDSLRSE